MPVTSSRRDYSKRTTLNLPAWAAGITNSSTDETLAVAASEPNI